MPQLILLIVGAIVWGIIKLISQPAQKAPPGRQSPRTTLSQVLSELEAEFSPQLSRPPIRPQPIPRQQPVIPAQPMPAAPAVLETEEIAEQDWLLEKDDFVRGIIMAELLSPPLARRPRRK